MTAPTDRYALQERRAEYAATAAAAGIDADLAPLDARQLHQPQLAPAGAGAEGEEVQRRQLGSGAARRDRAAAASLLRFDLLLRLAN